MIARQTRRISDLLTGRRIGATLVGISGLLGAVRFRVKREIRSYRESLATEHAADATFDPKSVADLPSPASRYLRHAIAPGTPIARRVAVTMEGQFRLGRNWRPFKATEVLAAQRGFVWEPTIQLGPGLWVSGADFSVDETAGQRFYLDGVVPVVRASGPAIDQSSAGRFLAESVWLPTSLLPTMGASWVGIAEHQARVTLPTVEEPLTVSVNEEGAIQSVETLRIDGDSGKLRSFGAFVESERTVDGMTIPWELEVGWDIGMDEYESFFRGELQQVTFY